jgi:hypothetical protein
MNKLTISKLLDTLALVAMLVIFAVYLFQKPSVILLSIYLILVALVKMGASMMRASYYSKLYNEVKQERDILKEQNEYLENEIKQNSNK